MSNNGVQGFNGAGSFDYTNHTINCAEYNNPTPYNTASLSPLVNAIGGIAHLTVNPYTNRAGLDFTINNTAGAGALLRALGFPLTMPGLTGVPAFDIGVFQHADPAALTQAGVADVRLGTVYATGTLTGTAAIPTAANVRSGTATDATTGTLAVPAASNVKHEVSVDNTTGTMTAATLGLSAADLRSGTVVDTTTGTAAIPTAANVRLGTATGATTGSLAVPAAGDVESGVAVDATTGTFTVPTAGQVQSGVGFGAAGTEFTGTLVATTTVSGIIQG